MTFSKYLFTLMLFCMAWSTGCNRSDLTDVGRGAETVAPAEAIPFVDREAAEPSEVEVKWLARLEQFMIGDDDPRQLLREMGAAPGTAMEDLTTIYLISERDVEMRRRIMFIVSALTREAVFTTIPDVLTYGLADEDPRVRGLARFTIDEFVTLPPSEDEIAQLRRQIERISMWNRRAAYRASQRVARLQHPIVVLEPVYDSFEGDLENQRKVVLLASVHRSRATRPLPEEQRFFERVLEEHEDPHIRELAEDVLTEWRDLP